MAKSFAEIAFTPTVRAQQERLGSAKIYDRFLAPEAEADDRLSPREAAFVEARDGIYQASVTETGWPYVQFKGGPKGFLKVIDERTIGYADFRGNRQYLSLGNLSTDDRVSLILMDYPNRARLKIFGRARRVEAADDPELVARLMPEGYRAKAEGAWLITVEGFDWNCPQHIPQRLTLEELEENLAPMRAEFEARLAPLHAEIERLRAENARLAGSGGETPD